MSGSRGDRFWSSYARIYDLAWDNVLTEQLGRDVVVVLPSRGPCRILEIGCGTGLITRWLTAVGHHVTATDSCPEMLTRAVARAPAAQLERWDALSLPESARGYDVIVATNVVQFLPNAELALDEWADRLAPGGVLVISQPRPGLTPWEAVLHMMRANGARSALPALRFVAAHLALAGMRLRWRAPTTRSAHLGSSTLVACGTQLLTTRNAVIDAPSA